MPAELTYPGVYIEEIPSGVRTIIGVSTSVAAFVGRTPRGPTDRPVTITSFADYERIFGGDANGAGGGLSNDYPIGFAVRDFYLNGGSLAIICRVYRKGTKDVAEFDVKDIPFVASSAGTWANKIRIRITKTEPASLLTDIAAKLGVGTGDLFNVTVNDGRIGGETETFVNLTTKPSARHITGILAAESALVRTKGTPATGPSGVHDPDPKDDIWKLDKFSTPVKAGSEGGDSNALGAATDWGTPGAGDGLYLLSKADLFNLLVIPPDKVGPDDEVHKDLHAAAAKFCHDKRALYIVDPPKAWKSMATVNLADLNVGGDDARYAAVYFPRVFEGNPLKGGLPEVFTASGAIAGVMARTDVSRGVWKAPAGIDATLTGVTALQVVLNDLENGQLNQKGVNCLRTFPVYGNIVWGARTLRGADVLADEYKYVPVRRVANFIEESLFRGLKWVVFEPNDEPLWGQIRLNVGAFMQDLFRQGAFQGTSPRDAYFVRCDKTTTTQNDINKGIVNIVVGFAPLKPAEFVVLKLTQIAGQIQT